VPTLYYHVRKWSKKMQLVRSGQLEENDDVLYQWHPVSPARHKDAAESRRVGRAIRAIQKQCWFNARRAILRLGEYADAGYVEGWAVVNGLPMEHGWIVRDGVVIDPTLPDAVVVYFPGLEFQGRDGIHEFLASKLGRGCKKSPFFYAFGWGGCQSPSFSQAQADAWNAVRAVADSHEDASNR
jgi:hypothetical protein